MTQEHLSHIKDRFEAQTGVVLPRRSVLRPLRRGLLTAAAVLCCLCVTALAANHFTGGALVRFFQEGGVGEAPTALSEAQLLTIERYTTEVGQTRTADDTAITLQAVTAAATGHDVIVYCVFDLEAPEGDWTKVDNDLLGFTHYYCGLEGDTAQSGSTSWLRVMDDPQGRENAKTVVIAYLVNARGDNRSLDLRIDLEDFWICEDRRQGGNLIAGGVWTFEAPLELEAGVSLLTEPVDLGGRTLSSLELTPLGGSMTVSLPALPREQWVPERLVMADGSAVEIRLEGGIHDEEAGVEYLSFTLPVPTDLTDAVAVEFAGGVRVEIP